MTPGSTARALLDVNVLIALLDAAHIHHSRARVWLEANASAGWASCPLTQNGCIRIMSLDGYPNRAPVLDLADRLAEATRHPSHRFWPDSISLLGGGRIAWAQVLTGHQITDAYLLALAVEHGGRFVTFDRGIPVRAVAGASEAHLVIL